MEINSARIGFGNGIIDRFARVHLLADMDEMRLREGRLIRASSQEGQSVSICHGVPSLFPPSIVPPPHLVRTPGR